MKSGGRKDVVEIQKHKNNFKIKKEDMKLGRKCAGDSGRQEQWSGDGED